MSRTWAFPLFFAVALAAREDDTISEPDPRGVDYDASLGIDISQMTETNSGLFYQDVAVGTGDVVGAGDEVDVQYTGWLPDGTMFDTSNDDGVPFTFTIGVSNVILGWHEGINGMQQGGVRLLVIPPSLGYGIRRNGPIPANSILVFRVEVVAVR